MSGFFYYLLTAVNPMTNIGFSSVFGKAVLPWMVFLAPLFLIVFLLYVGCWLLYVVKPELVRPSLPIWAGRTGPLVSVVIAGRNESQNIGQCIRAALRCGYSNLEVVFVDDCSDDDSVAIARRAVAAVTGSSRDDERVRIFPSPRRNGKPSSLNIGIRMARGEFIAIVDADSTISYGAIQHWLLPFSDARVGAVSGNIRVLNSTDTLLTRLQEIEYALKYTLGRGTAAMLNILSIVPGMGGMFRADIMRRLGGYDTGLGDDTDMSMNLLKQGWKLAFSLDAVVWTLVPKTRYHLWRQRSRWTRNLIKIRISKHRDQFVLGRYGFANAVIALRTLVVQLLLPWSLVVGVLVSTFEKGPLGIPMFIGALYSINLILDVIKMLMARDFSQTPQAQNFWLIFLMPLYRLWLYIPVLSTQFCELVRIGAKHPYVPDHVWQEIPWW